MFSEFDGAGHVVSEPAKSMLATVSRFLRSRTKPPPPNASMHGFEQQGDAPLVLNLSANLMSHLLRSIWGFSVSGSMASSTSLLCQSMLGIVPRSAI